MDEIHRMRIELQWEGDFSGSSRAVLIVMGSLDGRENLLKNTLGFISSHIQDIYEEMLKGMLTVFRAAGVGKQTKNGVVKSLADINVMREKKDFLYRIHINLDDIKQDIAVFSIFLGLQCAYGVSEECEFVFDHSTLLFWGDGNPGEHLLNYNSWGEVKCEFLQ